MRIPLRSAVVAGVSIGTVLSLGLVAHADDSTPMPTTRQLRDAQADVETKAQGVTAMQAQLDAAKSQLRAAELAASIAAEEYNGAMWRLSESRKAARKAKATATRLQERVVAQRDGMARLVVQSYQEGTQLNSMTAVLDAEGPRAIMGRQAVVDMASNSINADMERFKELSVTAKKAQRKAAAAAERQEDLAEQAGAARDAAAGAVSSAAALEGRISQQRDALVAELARSQNISLGLARQRQSALEAVAQRKADEAERVRTQAAAAAEQERESSQREREDAERAAQQARDEVRKAKKKRAEPAPAPRPAPAEPEPEVVQAPPSPRGGVNAAIAFARVQIGEPYRWGAAGPNSWDCSGLTMVAWSKGGISLPHYSQAQFSAGSRIPISAARPGDLYFWSSNGRPSGIHHVALATGGGSFIEAPRTGLDVRENHISNWFPTYAVRL